MNRFIASIFTILLTISTTFAQSDQISWRKDFKAALVDSRQNGKPILIYFTAADCNKCQEMDAQYWADAKVIESVKQFIAVKVIFDNDKLLAAKYNVTEAPFVGFTDPLGNLISFRRGFDQDAPRRLNVALKDVTKDFSNLEPAYQIIERKKDDGKALLEIADSYRTSGNLFLSSEFYKRAAKTAEVSGNAETKERVGFALGINAVGYRNYQQANEYLADYLKDYPSGKYRETAITLLIVGNANTEKYKEADKHLAQLKIEFPDSKNVAVAVKAIENAKNKSRK